MTTYRVRLNDRREIAESTMAFSFEKPASFRFRPGQFLSLKLIDPPETDAEGNGRDFSIASAPDEPELLLATRMRDTAFKRVLKKMPLGAQTEIEGPFGNLVLHSNPARPAVFLAGGIGITPFRSMILEATQKKLAHRIYLFYSNRRPEDAPFLEELPRLAEQNPNFKFVATMTKRASSHQQWQGKSGYIGKDMLVEVLRDLAGPIYYVAGPPDMVSAMQTMLSETGINYDDIRAEEFAGY